MTLRRTTSADPTFRQLVALLDEDLRKRDGEDHAFFAQFNTIDALQYVLVAYLDQDAAGCGAIKPFDSDSMEIKRMFVQPQYRKQGLAQQIVTELETWAKELGYSRCVLETGTNNPEAIALYLKLGYQIIPNYGQYKDQPLSVCMNKLI